MLASRSRLHLSIVAYLLVLASLIWLTVAFPPAPSDLGPALFFGFLMVFANVFGVALGGGIASLYPMITMAAFLVLDLVPVGWVAFVGALPYAALRYFYAERLGQPRIRDRAELAELMSVNAIMQTASMLISGAIYIAFGGVVPIARIDPGQLLPLVLLGGSYFTVNHFIAGSYFWLRDRDRLTAHIRQLSNLFLLEVVPVIISPLMALIYIELGWLQISVFSFVLVLLSLITHNLDRTRQRLERRVQELDSLQNVGRTISASLDLETIFFAIHTQVSRLMPANTFYVAMLDESGNIIRFPLAIERGEPVDWPSRELQNGLTEHILRTRQSLLIRNDLPRAMADMNISPVIHERSGSLATSWLGVPLIAGDKLLGTITVQSYSTPKVYDERDRVILETIAAQAALAIHNATDYARTDSALAERIRQLNSILNTTHDGILLVNNRWEVLAANPAFVNLIGMPPTDIREQDALRWPPENGTLIQRIGYDTASLQEEINVLLAGNNWQKQRIETPGAVGRSLERILVPVTDSDGAISGWLLLFRDVTEERELQRLREDMTHMLVHDLRSPLAVIMGSVETGGDLLEMDRPEDVAHTLKLARTSGERMLRLINTLLDVYRFESGSVPLYVEAVPIEMLLVEAKSPFLSLAEQAQISLEIDVESDLPPLAVDVDHMGRVLHNLVDNAIKFTPDHGTVRLWAKRDEQNLETSLLVGVADSGTGISPGEQAQMFEKFQQGLPKGGRRKGTGLGLPYCRLAVEAHGGAIWVESTGIAGEGCNFIIRLPVASEKIASPVPSP